MTWPVFAATVGWVGAVLLLAGYGLVSVRRLDGDGALFQLLNVGGSTGLGLAAVAGGVWSAAVLNGLWVAIGLAVLVRGVLRRQGGRRGQSARRGQTGHRGRGAEDQSRSAGDGVPDHAPSSDQTEPAGVSRISTPAEPSLLRIRSDVGKSRASRARPRSSSSRST